jgi:hypothetical protein
MGKGASSRTGEESLGKYESQTAREDVGSCTQPNRRRSESSVGKDQGSEAGFVEIPKESFQSGHRG